MESYTALIGPLSDLLVEAIARRAVASNEQLDQMVVAANSVLFPPATVQAIEATEKRLGRRLPEDYRTFLQFSNGMILPCLENHPARLLPVEDIRLFQEYDPSSFRQWLDTYGDENVYESAPLALMPSDITCFGDEFPGIDDRFLNSIAVSETINSGAVLLCEFQLPQSGVYEVWEIGPWTGCLRYRTFWHFLKDKLESFLRNS